MTRLQADLCLLLMAFLWGMAFVAQKTGMDGLGPMGFTGTRFVLSSLVVLPFAWREMKNVSTPVDAGNARLMVVLGLVFFLAVVAQQAGMLTTSVSNAGFLTGLYVIFVPFFAWIMFRRPPARIIWSACAIAFAGVWMLSGGAPSGFMPGDWLVLCSAFFYGIHIPLVGLLAQRTGRVMTLAFLQYMFCAVLGLAGAYAFEGGIGGMRVLENNIIQILYAGVISGGVAYTLQIIAQRHTPPSHAAIIMMLEAPFAGLAGALFLGDRLSTLGLTGCALILAAALLAESSAFLPRKYRRIASGGSLPRD